MIRELICKVFGHKPGYIRANYEEQMNKPPEDRVFKIKLGCIRCMELLDHDDYDSEDLKRRVEENHKRLGK
jgi:hypothetical protein